MRFTDFLKVFSLNPMWRIVRHTEYLEKHARIIGVVDKKSWQHVRKTFDKTASKLRVYFFIRTVLFVLLYVSFIAAMIKDTAPLLVNFLEPLRALVAVIGVGVFAILVVIMQKLIGALMEDLRIAHTHLVALAVKHNDGYIVHPEHRVGIFTEYLRAKLPPRKKG